MRRLGGDLAGGGGAEGIEGRGRRGQGEASGEVVTGFSSSLVKWGGVGWKGGGGRTRLCN
jgi:hypothetical protein